jgi:hypothetical protein
MNVIPLILGWYWTILFIYIETISYTLFIFALWRFNLIWMLSLYQVVEALWGCQSHIFWTISTIMVVRLLTLCSGRTRSSGRFLVLASLRGWVNRRALIWLAGLITLKESNDFLRIQIHDVPAHSIVPQPLNCVVTWRAGISWLCECLVVC